MYVRDLQNAGTVTGGTITQIPSSGPLVLDSPTPGDLSTAGESRSLDVLRSRRRLAHRRPRPGERRRRRPDRADAPMGAGAAPRRDEPRPGDGHQQHGGRDAGPEQRRPPGRPRPTRSPSPRPPATCQSVGNYVVSAYDVTTTVQVAQPQPDHDGDRRHAVLRRSLGVLGLGRHAGAIRPPGGVGQRAEFQPGRAERLQRILGHHGKLGAPHPADLRDLHPDRPGHGRRHPASSRSRWRRPPRRRCRSAPSSTARSPGPASRNCSSSTCRRPRP